MKHANRVQPNAIINFDEILHIFAFQTTSGFYVMKYSEFGNASENLKKGVAVLATYRLIKIKS